MQVEQVGFSRNFTALLVGFLVPLVRGADLRARLVMELLLAADSPANFVKYGNLHATKKPLAARWMQTT